MKIKCTKCDWVREGETVGLCISQLGEHNIQKHNMPRKPMRVEICGNKAKFVVQTN
jgi:hypothetical protein